jgi:hypothetical protein
MKWQGYAIFGYCTLTAVCTVFAGAARAFPGTPWLTKAASISGVVALDVHKILDLLGVKS